MINENHKVLVYKIDKLEKHPNADNLSIVYIDSYTVIVKTADWINREYGVFIPPDSVVPATEQYAFLATDGTLSSLEKTFRYRVIRAKKLRGIVSYGLLVPVPSEITAPYPGMELSTHMGITHYDPSPNEQQEEELKEIKTDQKKSKVKSKLTNYPDHRFSHKTYDLINHRKISSRLPEFDYISVTEKCHGSFMACTYSKPIRKYPNNICGKISKAFFSLKDKVFPIERRIMMKSKNYWKEFTKPIEIKALNKIVHPKKHNWELALEHNPLLKKLCKILPDHLIYGEIFGPIQKHYTYGHLLNNQPGPLNNKVQFKVFEIIKPNGDIIDGKNLYEFLTFISTKTEKYYDLCVPIIVWKSNTILTDEELDSLSNDRSSVIIGEKIITSSTKEHSKIIKYEFPDHRKEGVVLSFYNKENKLILKTKFVGSKYYLDEYKI